MIRNTIILNDKSSADIAGLIIQELPPITKPAQRTETEIIDGRDGDITTPLGFAAYDKEFTIGLYGDFDINAIIAFFNSEGTVVFSNEPDKYYNYQITEQIDFERLVRFRTAKVKMHCQPFKYSSTQGAETLDPPAENLLSIPDFTNTTNGVTLTVSDGTISVSGTPSAATEFYVPTGGLNLPAGSYTLTAEATGTRVASTSIRLIGSAPSAADSFGGNYLGLKNAQPVAISDTLSAAKTFNYLWFYITAGGEVDFNMTAEVQNNAEKTVSDEGTFLTLENSAEAPFNKLDLKGDSKQESISGKNKFGVHAETKTGVTITLNSDGTINVTGTATANTTFQTIIDVSLVENGETYAFWANQPLPAGVEARFGLYNGSTWVRHVIPATPTVLNQNQQSKTGTTNTTGGDNIHCQVYVASGTTVDLTNFGVQFEKGNATAFEKYVGGVPSPNPDYPQDISVVTKEQVVNLLGKNIFNPALRYATLGGVDISYDAENGYLTFNGTATSTVTAQPFSQYYPMGKTPILVKGGQTAKLSCKVISGSYMRDGTSDEGSSIQFWQPWNRGLQFFFRNAATTGMQWTDTEKHDDDTIFTAAQCRIHAGDVFNNYTISAQLEIDTVATDFEPFRGQSYEINLGKNLFNKDTDVMAGNYYLPGANSTRLATTGVVSKCLLLKLAEGKTYTISKLAGGRFRVGFTNTPTPTPDTDGVIASRYNPGTTATSGTFTVPKGNPYVICNYYSQDQEADAAIGVQAMTASIQVEEGSAATDFAEYFEAIEMVGFVGEQGTHRDYFRTDGTNWYKHKEIEKIASYDGETIPGDYISTTGELSTGATVYYALAEPVDEEITNEALVSQLNALNNAAAYRGRTHIISTSDMVNLPHIIAAEVMKISDGTITNAGNIYSKPRLTIYGSGDITINLNGIQLFQVALGDTEYITIDTAAMEAYKDSPGNLQNRLVTGDYDNFALNPGENQITFSGLVTKCVVENYSRWL